MRILLFIILLSIPGMLNAQLISPLDGQYSLLYIRPGTSVSISTRYLDAADMGMGGVYNFIIDSNKIKLRASNYGDDSKDGFTGLLAFYTYPDFLKIRNNDNKIVYNTKDSIVKDYKGRITKAYYTISPAQSIGAPTVGLREFHYLNDTTIYEISSDNVSTGKGIYIYELDAKQNLKAIRETELESGDSIQWNNLSRTIHNAKTWQITQFVYNKLKTRIEAIKILEKADNKSKVLFTQKFYYKEDLPQTSYVKDEVKNKIIYKQVYKYISSR